MTGKHKGEICKAIKEANKIVDKMNKINDTDSKEYKVLDEALYWTLDSLFYYKKDKFSLNLSKRTGHYYVTFFD